MLFAIIHKERVLNISWDCKILYYTRNHLNVCKQIMNIKLNY